MAIIVGVVSEGQSLRGKLSGEKLPGGYFPRGKLSGYQWQQFNVFWKLLEKLQETSVIDAIFSKVSVLQNGLRAPFYQFLNIFLWLLPKWMITLFDAKQGRSHWGARGAMVPPTSFSEPKKVQKSQFQTSGILLFMGVKKLYRPKISLFYCVCYNFWTIYGVFSFFLTTFEE